MLKLKDLKIRTAKDEDAEDVRHILDECGQIPGGLDWTHIEPFWLVAEHKGIIVGAIQTLIGKPLGHIGFWAVLPGYQNYGIGIYLLWAAEDLLAKSGCDGFTGMTVNRQVLKKLVKKGGMIFGEPCGLIFKRVHRKNSESGGDHGRRWQTEINNHN